jgi:hypothetical protein
MAAGAVKKIYHTCIQKEENQPNVNKLKQPNTWKTDVKF